MEGPVRPRVAWSQVPVRHLVSTAASVRRQPLTSRMTVLIREACATADQAIVLTILFTFLKLLLNSEVLRETHLISSDNLHLITTYSVFEEKLLDCGDVAHV